MIGRLEAFMGRTPETTATQRSASSGARRSGPFAAALEGAAGTADANQTAAAKEQTAAVKEQPAAAPATPAAYPSTPADLPTAFTPPAIESHMNAWLIGIINRENAVKTQTYEQALAGWNNGASRYRELGLPVPPRPEAPELAKAEGMPQGWWFETHT